MMMSLNGVVDQQPQGIGPGEIELTDIVLTGLGPFRSLSTLTIKPKIQTCEMLTGCEQEKRYFLNGPEGDTVYWAKESSNCCSRCLGGSIRGFSMTISDQTNQTVVELNRPLTCQGCCCSVFYPYCTQALNVSVGGESIGTIRERATWWYPVLHVFDSVGNQLFKIRGPDCIIICCEDIPFRVLDTEGAEVASITKKWMSGSCIKESLTAGDNFVLNFGEGMEVHNKVLLVAATFLIDMMYFAGSI